MNKYIFLIVSILFLVQGCESTLHKNNKSEFDSYRKEISQLTEKSRYDKVVNVDIPPFELGKINTSNEPDWLKERVTYSAASAPLKDVLQQVVNYRNNEEKLAFNFGEGVNPSQLVSVSVNDATVKEALNFLTIESGYGFVFGDNSIDVEKYISEEFSLKGVAGSVDFKMGSQDTASSTDAVALQGQYVNASQVSVSVVSKVEEGIKSILENRVYDVNGQEKVTKEGSVSYIESLSSLRVLTTPLRMVKVREYVKSIQDELDKQLYYEFRIIELRDSTGNEQGLDLDITRELAKGTLKFFSQGTSLYNSTSNYGLSFEGVNGWNGTTAFVKALEKQGKVVIDRPLAKLGLSNVPVRLNQTREIPYLYSVESNANENVITSSVERRTEKEGIDLLTIGNSDEDYAWVRSTGTVRSIVDDYQEVVNDTKLRFLVARNNDIDFTGKLRYGRTYIIGRISQTQVRIDDTKNFGVTLLGANSAEKEEVETIILLTVRRID
ncbi:STN domain-containing protein [Vibrio fluvialis]|uniref:STN domain-containing protein n=1 Tax=Vibrio fluvialis TaxID=676 RepID=UPI00192ACB44|nr:STN domain-containing protein [Vibrio fluvialis]MBL4262816.1 hypothetical protein [Vibrio fluvialis]